MFSATNTRVALGAMLAWQLAVAAPSLASSHMDAPLITRDDPANTTDVYAFKSKTGGVDYLTTALAVYPFEEPGIGPNSYGFDPAVDYEIHVALGNKVNTGRADLNLPVRVLQPVCESRYNPAKLSRRRAARAAVLAQPESPADL